MWIFWWRRKNPPPTNAYDVGIAAIDRARRKESTSRLFEVAKDLASKLGPGDRMKVTTPDGSVEVEKGEQPTGQISRDGNYRLGLPPPDDEELWLGECHYTLVR
jgi:hypothetical protein